MIMFLVIPGTKAAAAASTTTTATKINETSKILITPMPSPSVLCADGSSKALTGKGCIPSQQSYRISDHDTTTTTRNTSASMGLTSSSSSLRNDLSTPTPTTFSNLSRSAPTTFMLAADNTNTSEINEIPQIPSYIRTTAMFFCIVIMILGVIGNVMVPIVIVKTKDMRNSTNIFLINLSIADLLVLLVCTPTVLVEVNTRPETWILGHEMCKLVPFVELTVAHASVLTILAISFERYYAICEPLKAGYVCTKARAILICVLAWAVAAVFTSPILWVAEYTWVEYIDGSSVAVCLTQAITNWTIGFFLMTISVFFIMPLIILIVLYGIIAKNLISNSGPMMRIRPTKPEFSLKARKQVVLMLGAVVLSFFLCLLPFRLFTMWIILSAESAVLDLGIEKYYGLLYFCRIMLYLNSAINPILYNLMSTKFRKGFLKLIFNTWRAILTILTFGRHKRGQHMKATSGTIVGGVGGTNTNTSSNAATATSSSVLSRSSNRRRSSDDITRTKVQIQMQIPCGSDSEMIAMLHTTNLIPEDAEAIVQLENRKIANKKKSERIQQSKQSPQIINSSSNSSSSCCTSHRGRNNKPQITFDERNFSADEA